MIKVVEAISDTNIGGAGVLLLNRLENTDRRIIDTTVIIPKGSELKNRFFKLGVRVVEINCGKDSSFDIKTLAAYIYVIKKLSPDILSSHGSLNSRIAGILTGVPSCIYTRHCVYPVSGIYKIPPIRFLFGKATDLLSERVVAVSYSAKQNLTEMGVNPDKINVIINGAKELKSLDKAQRSELKKRLMIPQDSTVVAIYARLEACKDHKTFLRAARLLCSRDSNYRFLIVGKGSLAGVLSEYCKRLGISDKVIFTGFVEDISPYMNITDINVNCSIGTETSSLALSEGMSLSVPAVASNYGGNPYMIKNGINGYIYRSGDFRDLANKIEIAKKNHRILGEKSRIRFENELNAASMTQKMQTLYINLYNENKKRYD